MLGVSSTALISIQPKNSQLQLNPLFTSQTTDTKRKGGDAIADKHKEKWLSAMQDEMDSLHENYTYDLVELPKGKRALRNKWVYKVKTGEVDNTPRYKARIVVNGFQQKKGVDFDEIFAPVVKMASIRIVLSIAASMDLEIKQLDVKMTFLHGELDEEIYMQ